MRFLIRLLASAAALAVATAVVPGIELTTASVASKVLTLLGVALIFGVVNAILKPIVKIVGCVFYILTLGLIALVVNALLLWFTSWLAGKLSLPWHITGFWPAFWGALLVSVVARLLGILIRDKPRVEEQCRAPGGGRVEGRAAVREDVVVVADLVVPGPRQGAGRGEDGRLVPGDRPGQRVAVRADDDGAADPGDAPLGPAPVRDRDEHPVHAGVCLHPDDVAGPLTGWHRHGGPVHRRGEQVGAAQRNEPDPFGELQVVTDHQADPAERQAHHRRCRRAPGEHELLRRPQVCVAVAGPHPVPADHGGAVVDQPILTQPTEPARDGGGVPRGQRLPLAERRAVRGGRGQRSRFRGIGEHVAAVTQFRQHHQFG